MPRYPQRKHDALELLERLERGPEFNNIPPEHKEQFMLWLNSWITPKVEQLIPELAKLRQEGKLK